MSMFQTADRIDYCIRRYIHATDHLWSTPHAIRRSRATRAPQSKLIPAPDRSVWLSIGHYLRVQYDALSAPIPPHITALVSNSKRRNSDPQRCGPTAVRVCRRNLKNKAAYHVCRKAALARLRSGSSRGAGDWTRNDRTDRNDHLTPFDQIHRAEEMAPRASRPLKSARWR